jgi:serine O-acetyltransferase
MFENIRADISSYKKAGLRWRSEPGFWIGANYRFGRWGNNQSSRFLRQPLIGIHKLTSLPFRLILGAELSRDAEIGPGLVLFHGRDVMIPTGSKLGRDCLIFHEVTLGVGPRPGLPQLDDNVVVFSGARVLGGIHLGARAEIGTCCVVNRDIPAGTVVVPPIPRILTREMTDAVRNLPSEPDARKP